MNDEQATPPPEVDGRPEARDDWEQEWGRPEADRVARWLRSKGAAGLGADSDERADGQVRDERPVVVLDVDLSGGGTAPSSHRGDGVLSGPDGTPDPTVPDEAAGAVDGPTTGTGAMEQAQEPLVVALEALRAELLALEERRRRLAAEVASHASAVAAAEEERRRVADEAEAERQRLAEEHRRVVEAAEAERRQLSDRRRRLVAAFEAEQAEVERVRQLQKETSARLERELSVLQRRVDQLTEAAQAAAAAAEQARLAEQRALSDLRAAEERAGRREAERFDVWIALDAEITALERRRDELAPRGGPDHA